MSPPVVVLEATDLSTSGWTSQPEATWILLPASLGTPPVTAVRPVVPALRIPYTLQWSPERAQTAAIARFVRLALTHDVPRDGNSRPGICATAADRQTSLPSLIGLTDGCANEMPLFPPRRSAHA